MAISTAKGTIPLGRLSVDDAKHQISTSETLSALQSSPPSRVRYVLCDSTVKHTSTPMDRVPLKPVPDFEDNSGLHSSVVNFNPPRRALCARVPKQLDLNFAFSNLQYNGREYDRETWSYRTSSDLEGGIKYIYVVFGIFSGIENRPKERVVLIKDSKHLLWHLHWNWIRLRGLRFLFSLKGLKGLGLYECNWLMGTHSRIELDSQAERILDQLWCCFNKFQASSEANRRFADWIHENLNHSSYEPAYPSADRIVKNNHFDESGNWQPRPDHQQHNEDCALSLELIMGWSVFRISLAVLAPVALSLIFGLWYQKATGDSATAWVIATYIVTSAGIIAALLALLTGLESKA